LPGEAGTNYPRGQKIEDALDSKNFQKSPDFYSVFYFSFKRQSGFHKVNHLLAAKSQWR